MAKIWGEDNMKFKDDNIKKFDQDAYNPFDFTNEVFTDEMQIKSGNFITDHPIAAVTAAGAMLAAPIIGMGMTSAVDAQAASLPENQDVQATYVETADTSDTVELTETIEDKVVHFTASGPGHIEPVENCTVDGATGEIKFINPDANASFKLVYDVEGATSAVSMGSFSLPETTNFVMLEAHSNYSTIDITFDDTLVQQQAAADEAQRLADEQARAEEQARLDAQNAVSQANIVAQQQQQQAAAQTQQQAAPQQQQHQVVQQQQAAPAVQHQAVNNAAPASGAPRHSMSSEENEVAHQIFDAYNNYRASKGLQRVAWSDDCANMAYGSATGCAASGTLKHRLGIPGAVQGNYSDILQYSTWKMSGNEAVQRWSTSDGHRKMMQCSSTGVGGVAAYKDANGIWYYAIVYNFQGTNQGGN